MAQVTLISPITKQPVGKIRVCAYCRVSSSSQDQLNSYAMQIKTYTDLIKRKPEWELVDIFADEGISGTRAENRPEFQRMIQMCEIGKIDLIITKSISRFARNIKESLEYVRKLKLLGVGVKFEKEGIYTLSMKDEMLLDIFSTLAEQESLSISENLRLSITKRMESGRYVDSNAPYGFRLVDKHLMIYPQEAEVVKLIYQMYLDGCSTTEIGRELDQKGIPTKDGAPKWKSTKIAYILKNEKYIGDTLYQKTFRSSTVPFRQYTNRGEQDQFYATGTHEGFIDRETFEKVQELYEKRSRHYAQIKTQPVYPLTSMIECAECGTNFNRRLVGGAVKWACRKHIEDSQSCDSNYYAEERIYDGFIAMVNKLRFANGNVIEKIIQQLETITRTRKRNNTAVKDANQNLWNVKNEMRMLAELKQKGYVDTGYYQQKVYELNREMEKFQEAQKKESNTDLQIMLGNLYKLKSILDKIDEPLEVFDEDLFSKIVTKITINHQDEMTMTIIGGLKFTEVI